MDKPKEAITENHQGSILLSEPAFNVEFSEGSCDDDISTLPVTAVKPRPSCGLEGLCRDDLLDGLDFRHSFSGPHRTAQRNDVVGSFESIYPLAN